MKPQVITELPVAGSLPELLHGQLRVAGPAPPQGHPAWGHAAPGLGDTSLPLPARASCGDTSKHLQRVPEGTAPSPQALGALLGLGLAQVPSKGSPCH